MSDMLGCKFTSWINSIPMPAFSKTSGSFSAVCCFILDWDITWRVKKCFIQFSTSVWTWTTSVWSSGASLWFSASFWSFTSHVSTSKVSIHFCKNKIWNSVKRYCLFQWSYLIHVMQRQCYNYNIYYLYVFLQFFLFLLLSDASRGHF